MGKVIFSGFLGIILAFVFLFIYNTFVANKVDTVEEVKSSYSRVEYCKSRTGSPYQLDGCIRVLKEERKKNE